MNFVQTVLTAVAVNYLMKPRPQAPSIPLDPEPRCGMLSPEWSAWEARQKGMGV